MNCVRNEMIQQDLKHKVQLIRLDGIPNILQSANKLMQTLWSIVFVVFCGFCLYLINGSCHEYGEFRVTTSYRLNSEIRSIFPTVTLCSLNPWNSQSVVDELLNGTYDIIDFNQITFYSLAQMEYIHKNKTGSYLTYEEKRRMFDFEGFIVSCFFQKKACNLSDFRYIFIQPIKHFNFVTTN